MCYKTETFSHETEICLLILKKNKSFNVEY